MTAAADLPRCECPCGCRQPIQVLRGEEPRKLCFCCEKGIRLAAEPKKEVKRG